MLGVSLSPYSEARVARNTLIITGDRDYFSSMIDGVMTEPFDGHLPTDIRSVLQDFLHCGFGGEMARTYRRAKILELLSLTARALVSQRLLPIAAHGHFSATDSKRIMKVHDIINARFSEDWTLSSLARAGGLNREKLRLGFRELYDMTPIEMLRMRRLKQARRMLMTTDRAVALVAYDNGYRSSASFTRAFGKEFGQSPQMCRLGFVGGR